MHRTLRELLPRAKGESHLVVVVFLDVRGFSSFARLAESSEAALFLRSAYSSILTDYFPTAAFFKPTGDGLLIIVDYDDENLSEVVNSAVNSAVKLVEEFPKICTGDPMVNFAVPGELGIGLARGAATALVSDEKVLDYSGRPLNLAARLMDLARPSGVVFSDNLVVGLLNPSLAKQFQRESVYVKGIADDDPMVAYVLKSRVKLPESCRNPLNRYDWKTSKEETLPLKKLQEKGVFLYDIPVEPILKSDIRVHFRYPDKTKSGQRHPSIWRTYTHKGEYVARMGNHFVRVEHDKVSENLSKWGVKSTWPVTVTVEYALPPS